jgi:hypothetical protein
MPASGETRLFKAPSPVAGEGVFCSVPIAAGEVVIRALVGRRVHKSEHDAIDWGTYAGRIMQIDEDWYLEGTGDLVDFINHSCDPNLGFDATGEHFIALRDIAAGEELLFHYSTSENDPDWSVRCECGSRLCSGRIAGFGNLPASEQARLLPIALPYLRRRYGRARG